MGRPVNVVRIVRGVRIPTREPGCTLAADLFLPATAAAAPALVTLTPYRRDGLGGVGVADLMTWFAVRGYAGVVVDLRGTGSSDGALRPPFDPGEGDDGVAAVEWAAAQPWCDGAVGMWGFSYTAALALRTASRRPPALKAIIPVMGLADGARDFVHPSGVRGCLAPLGVWTLGTVLDLMLPPLRNFRDPAEQARWRRRMAEADPYPVDVLRHGPDDEVWRSRAIDPAEVEAPALCVTGWRDVFCSGAARVYERLGGPKKLLAGPWAHTMPHQAPVEPVDFPGLALRWWDRWLSGVDNGVDREPPVTGYVQGAAPGWRHFASWPPPAKVERRVVPALSGRADPTVGPLSGMWGIPTGQYGFPRDQHSDDLASLTVTGAPLTRPLLVLGRPVVTCPGPVPRMVVKLVDVDPRGRATLVTGGVLTGSGELDPTCYRVAAGHRLRITVAAGAFPRLWPVSGELSLDGFEVAVPVGAHAEGQPTALSPPAPAGPGLWVRNDPRWHLRRDPGEHTVTVVLGGTGECVDPTRTHRIALDSELSATAGDVAVIDGRSTTTVHMGTGETVVVRVAVHSTEDATTVTGTVTIDDETVATRRWAHRRNVSDGVSP